MINRIKNSVNRIISTLYNKISTKKLVNKSTSKSPLDDTIKVYNIFIKFFTEFAYL